MSIAIYGVQITPWLGYFLGIVAIAGAVWLAIRDNRRSGQ